MNTSEMVKTLYEKGYEPIPVTPDKKFYDGVNWRKLKLPLKRWPLNHGISLRTGSTTITPADIDIYDSEIVSYLLDAFDFRHLTRIGQPPKVLVPLLCTEIRKKLLSDAYVDENGVINRIRFSAPVSSLWHTIC